MNFRIWFCTVAVFLTCFVATTSSAEDAAELQQKGIAALKDSQTYPDAIVLAARCFAKASAIYESNGKPDLAVEMNSYLYYCKKKMTMKDIDTFLKGEETTVSARLTAVENKPPAQSDAQAYLDRVDSFARANPSEHFLAAVRFFEVADRFKDTDAGRTAMSKSLAEMQQVIAQNAKSEKPIEATLGKPINLLALIDPARDAVDGKWGFDGQILVGETAEHARLEIPCTVPKEYDFKIVFMRVDGSDHIGQILQVAGHQFSWVVDAWDGRITGFEMINGKHADRNPTTFKGSLLKNGQWHTSTVRVRNDGVSAIIDGKEVVHFKTNYENMAIHPAWKLRDKASIGVQHQNKVLFKTIELIPWTYGAQRMQHDGEAAKLEPYRPASSDGKAFVKSEPPGAAILLVTADGRKQDTGKVTPALVQLPIGDQTIELTLKAYRPATFHIGVEADSIVKPDALKLSPITAPVNLMFEEGWRVFVDGNAVRLAKFGKAETPCTVELPLGSHEIELAKLGFLDIRQRVEITDEGIKRPGQSPTNAFEIMAKPSKGTSSLMVRDLMSLIDPARDTVAGKWQVQNGKLLSEKSVRAILQFPYHPPEEYDLNVEVSQLKKARHIFLVICGPNVQFAYQMGHDNSAGFEVISGKRAGSEATKPFAFEPDKKYKVTIKVRKDRVSAYVDDKLISDFATDYRDLSLYKYWTLRDRRALAVTADETLNVYHSITVTEISGPGEVVREKP